MEKNVSNVIVKKIQEDSARFEYEAWNQGAYLCGVDEVGRGAFAGPIVTAAVILKPFLKHNLLVDSKILSEKNRIKANDWILSHSWYAFGMADSYEIDNLGVYRSTQNAMLRALYGLLTHSAAPFPQKIIIDAMPIFLNSFLPQNPIIECYNYGETVSISVAAASIIAKIKRDTLLSRWGDSYLAYNFKTHKAYGTKKHYQEIDHNGTIAVHRKTFIKNSFKGISDEHRINQQNQQKSLFC